MKLVSTMCSSWIYPNMLKLCFLFLCIIVNGISSFRLLAILPHTGKSHFDAFEPLLSELAQRGHDLTVLSFFPQKIEQANYKDINLEGTDNLMINALPFKSVTGLNALTDFFSISQIGVDTCKNVLGSDQVQNLIRSNETFDLALVELFTTDCFLAIPEKLKTPFIGLSSTSIFPTTEQRFGNPDNPSYVANMFLPYTEQMTFSERFTNTITTFLIKYYRSYYDSYSSGYAKKFIGRDLRPLKEIASETDLILVNSHYTINRPRPFLPNIIEVGGIHIKPTNPLPNNLKKFITEATDGVIYVSFGSVLKMNTMPDQKLKAFLFVFSQIKQRIIWKFEDAPSHVKNTSDNILVGDWFPQRDILDHPNVKLFISHGGLLGVSEAIFSAVPILGIPMYGDQGYNLAAIKAAGAGIVLPFQSINNFSLMRSLNEILTKDTYTENVKELSEMYRQRPVPPLEEAIYWIEFSAKNKKINKFIKFHGADLYWFQIHLFDVLFVILGPLLIILYCSLTNYVKSQKQSK